MTPKFSLPFSGKPGLRAVGAGLAVAGLVVFTLGRSFERRGEVREEERRADEAEAVIADLLVDVPVS